MSLSESSLITYQEVQLLFISSQYNCYYWDTLTLWYFHFTILAYSETNRGKLTLPIQTHYNSRSNDLKINPNQLSLSKTKKYPEGKLTHHPNTNTIYCKRRMESIISSSPLCHQQSLSNHLWEIVCLKS